MKNKNCINNLPGPEKRTGKNNGRWIGGIFKRNDGYVAVRIGVVMKDYIGARYKLQHRVVMEKKLGRPLLRNEIVHHKNGIKHDNRISNLQLTNHTDHAKNDYKFRKINKKTGRFKKGKPI